MTTKDQSKYPYDRSEYVVMPPIRKEEDGTLTTEPQKVENGLLPDKVTTPCGKEISILHHKDGRAYVHNGVVLWDTISTHRTELLAIMLKEDELRYNDKSKPKQELPPIDVEAIKIETKSFAHEYDASCGIWGVGYKTLPDLLNKWTDHLASAGYLRAPLPKIDGLEEAIKWQNGRYSYYDYRDKFNCPPQVIIDEAARAYLKASGV